MIWNVNFSFYKYNFYIGQQWWQDKVKAEQEAKKAEEAKKAPAPAAKGGPAKPAPAARGGGAAGRGAPASRGAPAARGRGAATTPARGLSTMCIFIYLHVKVYCGIIRFCRKSEFNRYMFIHTSMYTWPFI